MGDPSETANKKYTSDKKETLMDVTEETEIKVEESLPDRCDWFELAFDLAVRPISWFSIIFVALQRRKSCQHKL